MIPSLTYPPTVSGCDCPACLTFSRRLVPYSIKEDK